MILISEICFFTPTDINLKLKKLYMFVVIITLAKQGVIVRTFFFFNQLFFPTELSFFFQQVANNVANFVGTKSQLLLQLKATIFAASNLLHRSGINIFCCTFDI